MINSKDIEAIGSLNMGDRQMLGLTEPWEDFTNIRLKRDGNYIYWKPRGGTTDEGLSVSNHINGFFFKARVGGVVNDYLARQLSNGDVVIYEYPSWTEVNTISGFSANRKVQFVPIGMFLYVFDGDQAKYINLSTNVVSDFLSTESGNIIGVNHETVSSLESIFPIYEGERALIFPGDIGSLSYGNLEWRGYTWNYSDQWDSNDLMTIYTPIRDRPGDFDMPDPVDNPSEWDTLYTEASNNNKGVVMEAQLTPGNLYKLHTETLDVDINGRRSDPDGFISRFLTDGLGVKQWQWGTDEFDDYIYFTVDEECVLDLEDWVLPSTRWTPPKIEKGEFDFGSYNRVRLATITVEFSQQFSEDMLAARTDDGQRIWLRPADPDSSLDYENEAWIAVGYSESLEGYIGAPRYGEVDIHNRNVIIADTPEIPNWYDDWVGSGDPLSNNFLGDLLGWHSSIKSVVDIRPVEDSGGILYNNTTDNEKTTFYRSYTVVDVLDDGSVSINGRPEIVKIGAISKTAGVSLSIGGTSNNVAKRYLCASRYSTSKEDTISPSTEDNTNSPWYIIREVDADQSSVFDSTPDKYLVRPIQELLPTAAGIPTIFGSGQIIPHSVSPYKDIFVIGGYTINRPTPQTYTNIGDNGNVYINQSGADTSNVAHFVFEYTDGTFSSSDSVVIQDGGSKAQVHSLNSLVSKVHVYVDDGTNTWKIDSFTQDDSEFMGFPFTLPTAFTDYEQKSPPSGNAIKEQINLSNYVTVPVPPQQIYIGAQASVFGNSSIVGTVPLDYDVDKSTLRYRVMVFTEDDIQTGYISEVSSGSNVRYNVNFEIADESRRASKRESIFRVGGSIFFQDSNGVHSIRGGQAEKVINKNQYPFLDNDLTSIAYNEAEDELWFSFGGSSVYVIDSDDGYRSVFDFGNISVVDMQWFDDQLMIFTSDRVCRGDNHSVTTDLGTNIVSTATSRYLSDHRLQILLHEILIYGIGGNVNLLIDDGANRLEGATGNPSNFDFASSQNFSQLSNELYGALFTPRVRGVRPRVQLELTGDFQIEDVEIKTTTLANEGVSRLTT